MDADQGAGEAGFQVQIMVGERSMQFWSLGRSQKRVADAIEQDDRCMGRMMRDVVVAHRKRATRRRRRRRSAAGATVHIM